MDVYRTVWSLATSDGHRDLTNFFLIFGGLGRQPYNSHTFYI